VSSRAFLELILFVGCQPVAGEAGLGKEDVELEIGNRRKKDREKETKREKDGRWGGGETRKSEERCMGPRTGPRPDRTKWQLIPL